MSQSSQSEKKSETNISELTEKVVFKGGKFNHNLLNMTNTIKATPPQEESEYQVKTQNNDNLSFRTNDEIVIKNKKNTIEQLCEKVTHMLKTHKIPESPITLSEKNKESEMSKIFVKKTEKELEVFESERLPPPNKSSASSSSDENSPQNMNIVMNTEKESNNSRKYLNKVICTLSKNESGFATFVSKDDLIFVLPSLFIPSNLNVGNTYVFKLAEVDQAKDKVDKVNEIHNYYAHQQL